MTVRYSDRQKNPPSKKFSGGKAIIVHPYLKSGAGGLRAPHEALGEAKGLAAAIFLKIVMAETRALMAHNPATLIGKGAVKALCQHIKSIDDIDVVIINHILTPVQQRNLERALNCKVIDRTNLILEIFGERARTHEGQLQVELAAQQYQKSRLVRSWTHLERQRGGAGFMGGPGERQLEIDRRLITARIKKLQAELKKVRKTRQLHRKSKYRRNYPVIALVGYTNAGKSTLFNLLSGANVVVKNQLFATLDPTMRAISLGNGMEAIISDTVGFITDLPTHLIESFKATLEEIQEADLIIHVRDIAHPQTEAQLHDVIDVLHSLGIDLESDATKVVEVWNKADKLDENAFTFYQNAATSRPNVVLLSATENQEGSRAENQGADELRDKISKTIDNRKKSFKVCISVRAGAAISWLYAHGDVESQKTVDETLHLILQIDPKALRKAYKLFNLNDIMKKYVLEK